MNNINHPTSLQDAVSEIRDLHAQVIASAKKTLTTAIRIGELLTTQKTALGHGKFLPWIAGNLPFSDRTARNYIRLYEARDRLKLESVSDLTSAYRMLAQPSGEVVPTKSEPPVMQSCMYLLGEDGNLRFLIEPIPGNWGYANVTKITLDDHGDVVNVEGTRRGVHQSAVNTFMEHALGADRKRIEWQFGFMKSAEPSSSFNRWVFDDQSDYMRRGLGVES